MKHLYRSSLILFALIYATSNIAQTSGGSLIGDGDDTYEPNVPPLAALIWAGVKTSVARATSAKVAKGEKSGLMRVNPGIIAPDVEPEKRPGIPESSTCVGSSLLVVTTPRGAYRLGVSNRLTSCYTGAVHAGRCTERSVTASLSLPK